MTAVSPPLQTIIRASPCPDAAGRQPAKPRCELPAAEHPVPGALWPGGRWVEALPEGHHHGPEEELALERGGGLGQAG